MIVRLNFKQGKSSVPRRKASRRRENVAYGFWQLRVPRANVCSQLFHLSENQRGKTKFFEKNTSCAHIQRHNCAERKVSVKRGHRIIYMYIHIKRREERREPRSVAQSMPRRGDRCARWMVKLSLRILRRLYILMRVPMVNLGRTGAKRWFSQNSPMTV